MPKCCNVRCSNNLSEVDIVYNGRFCTYCIRDFSEILIRCGDLVLNDRFIRGSYKTLATVQEVKKGFIKCGFEYRSAFTPFYISVKSYERVLVFNKFCKKPSKIFAGLK